MSANNTSNKKKTGKKQNRLTTVLIIICVIVIIISGAFLIRQIADYKADDAVYEQAIEYAGIESDTSGSDAASGTDSQTTEAFPEIDFPTLLAEGPDVKAWLQIPDTVINYPVTQSDDDSYYLTHLYNMKSGKAGSLFIEAQNKSDFSDPNTIIYGHSMKNGSMFAYLLRFHNQDYFDSHSYGYLITPEEDYKLVFFAAFTAQPGETGNSSPWKISFTDSEEYASWLDNMKSRSDVSSDIQVSAGDRTVTLSTCSQKGKKRYVVIGKIE